MARIKVGVIRGGQFRALPPSQFRTAEEEANLELVREKQKSEKLRQVKMGVQLADAATNLFGGAIAGGISRLSETSIEDQRKAAVAKATAEAQAKADANVQGQQDAATLAGETKDFQQMQGFVGAARNDLEAERQAQAVASLDREAAMVRPADHSAMRPKSPLVRTGERLGAETSVPEAAPIVRGAEPMVRGGTSGEVVSQPTVLRDPAAINQEIQALQKKAGDIAQLARNSSDTGLKKLAAERLKEIGTQVAGLRQEAQSSQRTTAPEPQAQPVASDMTPLMQRALSGQASAQELGQALGVIQERLRVSQDIQEVGRLDALSTKIRQAMDQQSQATAPPGPAQAATPQGGDPFKYPGGPTTADLTTEVSRLQAKVDSATADDVELLRLDALTQELHRRQASVGQVSPTAPVSPFTAASQDPQKVLAGMSAEAIKTPTAPNSATDYSQASLTSSDSLERLRANMDKSPHHTLSAMAYEDAVAKGKIDVAAAAAKATKDAEENILDWAGAAAMIRNDPSKAKQALAALKRSGYVGVRPKSLTELISGNHITRAQKELIKLMPRAPHASTLSLRKQQEAAAKALTDKRVDDLRRDKELHPFKKGRASSDADKAQADAGAAKSTQTIKAEKAKHAAATEKNKADKALDDANKAFEDAKTAASKATTEAEKARMAPRIVAAKIAKDKAQARASKASANLANTRAATDRALRQARKNKLIAETDRAKRDPASMNDKPTTALKSEASQLATAINAKAGRITQLRSAQGKILISSAREKIQVAIDKMEGELADDRTYLTEIRDTIRKRAGLPPRGTKTGGKGTGTGTGTGGKRDAGDLWKPQPKTGK